MAVASGYPARIDVSCVIGGVSHDLDFVRLELLRMLGQIPNVRTAVHSDYDLGALLERSSALISYTCDVRPSAAAAAQIEAFVREGGRWLALHATNSFLEWTAEGVASAHDDGPFFTTLGTAFVAHPPIEPFQVHPTEVDHPLTRGIEPFTITDELYLSEVTGDLEVLLSTSFSGTAPGFVVNDWHAGSPQEAERPVMYLHQVGKGSVLYLTPGHARGHWDAPHRTPYYPQVERGAWEHDSFCELVRRSLRWAIGDPAFHPQRATEVAA